MLSRLLPFLFYQGVFGSYGGVRTSDGIISFPIRSADTITGKTSNNPNRGESDRTLLNEQLLPQVAQVAGLFQGFGTHYVDLWCGTPKQRQTVIIATGAGKIGFPCKGCESCGSLTYHTDQYFDGDNSSSFRKLTCGECLAGTCGADGFCDVSAAYQEGSTWRGYEAEDVCYTGGLHTVVVDKDDPALDPLDPAHAADFEFPLKYGCQQHVTSLFKTQLADGIVGMSNNDESLWSQMYNAGKIKNPAFSVCYRRRNHVLSTGAEAGALSLGGTDARLHSSDMVYSAYEPEIGNTRLFTVRINNIYLRAGGGGTSVVSTDPSSTVKTIGVSEDVLNRGGIFVDTGTTDTYLWEGLASQFNAVFKELAGTDYTQAPQSFTEDELAMQPTILLQLAGNITRNGLIVDTNAKVVGLAGDLDPANPLDILVAIPPEHYYELDVDSNKYVARIYFDDSRDDIIGANALIGHDVLFQGGQAGLGWAESNCTQNCLTLEAKTKIVTQAMPEMVTVRTENNVDQDVGSYSFYLGVSSHWRSINLLARRRREEQIWAKRRMNLS